MMAVSVASARANSPEIRPLDMTTMRSAFPKASLRSEVENTMPSPSRASRRMTRKISAFAPTSTPRVGSSSRIKWGSVSKPLPITTFCWFPPLSAVTSTSGDETFMVSRLIIRRASARSLASRMREQPGKPAQACERQIGAHRHRLHQPFALPILRNENQSVADAAPDRLARNVLALEFDPTPRRRLQAHQTLEQFRPARAKQPI